MFPRISVSVRSILLTLAIAAVAWQFGGRSAVQACPFCAAPQVTLSEQVSRGDIVLLVQFKSAIRSDGENLGSTIYAVQQVHKDRDKKFTVGETINLDRFRVGNEGDLAVLFGKQFDKIEWSEPIEVTEAAYEYIAHLPAAEASIRDRLLFFSRYLESPENVIANDAYGEFALAPFEDIEPLAAELPRDKLRQWIQDPKTSTIRLGLYGLLLGLCGDESDKKLLEERVSASPEEYRLGIDGQMAGYLMLAGDSGLELIVERKFRNKSVHFNETYAGMMALRFMWQYGKTRTSEDNLRAAMRTLLDRSELADLVITNLARWKDWSISDRLMTLYGQGDYDVPSIKRAIVRFMLAASKETTADGKSPDFAIQAAKNIEILRKKDPKIVQDVERFSNLSQL